SAKALTGHAVERLRTAIYALHHGAEESSESLPVLLRRLSTVHLPSDLTVVVTVRGTQRPLAGALEHAVLRITGEALFNAVSHTDARQAVVRLHYRDDRVVLSVSDDGGGDPVQLRKMLRVSTAADLGGGHRGLANMQGRCEEFGGMLTIRRSALGGITMRAELPAPPRIALGGRS
ncbi:MAG: sensor histidine kinase, partial [Sciscionella sp.]